MNPSLFERQDLFLKLKKAKCVKKFTTIIERSLCFILKHDIHCTIHCETNTPTLIIECKKTDTIFAIPNLKSPHLLRILELANSHNMKNLIKNIYKNSPDNTCKYITIIDDTSTPKQYLKIY